MKFARTAVKAAVIAAMSAGACGIGAAIAHADHHDWQPPWAPWAPVIWNAPSERWGVVVGGVFVGI